MNVFDSSQPEQDRRDTLPVRTMADVLALPEDLRTIMDYLIEQGEISTRALLTDLIEKGLV